MKRYFSLALILALWSCVSAAHADGWLGFQLENKPKESLHEIYAFLTSKGFTMGNKSSTKGEDWGESLIGAFVNEESDETKLVVMVSYDEEKNEILIYITSPSKIAKGKEVKVDEIAALLAEKYGDELKVIDRKNYSGKW